MTETTMLNDKRVVIKYITDYGVVFYASHGNIVIPFIDHVLQIIETGSRYIELRDSVYRKIYKDYGTSTGVSYEIESLVQRFLNDMSNMDLMSYDEESWHETLIIEQPPVLKEYLVNLKNRISNAIQ